MQKPSSNNLLRISLLVNLITLIAGLGLVYWMGGFQHLVNRLKNRGLSAEYEMQISQLELIPTKPKDIVFLGNSLIANGQWQEWFGENRVGNQGIRGDGIEGIMKRIPRIAESKPEKLIVLIGINDLAFHDSQWLLEKYTLLVKQLKDQMPTTKVFIQSILPVNNHVKDTGYSNERISLFNKELEKLVTQAKLYFVDLKPLFADQSGNLHENWTLDGLHLTGIAYEQWALFLKQQISYTKTE